MSQEISEAYIKERFGAELPSENVDALRAAMQKYDTRWWESSDPGEVAEYQLFEDILMTNFGLFHEGIEKLVGRPVFTHEFGLNVEGLRQEACEAIARRLNGLGLETSEDYKQEATLRSLKILQDYCKATGKYFGVAVLSETPQQERN